MNEKTNEKPLSVKQAAEFLNLKPTYIYNLVFYGKLKAYKPGGKIMYFKQADLEKYAYRNVKGDLSDEAETILNKKKRKSA